jgi:hypothetical protein
MKDVPTEFAKIMDIAKQGGEYWSKWSVDKWVMVDDDGTEYWQWSVTFSRPVTATHSLQARVDIDSTLMESEPKTAAEVALVTGERAMLNVILRYAFRDSPDPGEWGGGFG